MQTIVAKVQALATWWRALLSDDRALHRGANSLATRQAHQMTTGSGSSSHHGAGNEVAQSRAQEHDDAKWTMQLGAINKWTEHVAAEKKESTRQCTRS